MQESMQTFVRIYFRRLGLLLLGLVIILCGWFVWSNYDYRVAVREAKAAGFEWEAQEPADLIKNDWHAIFDRHIWNSAFRSLSIRDVSDLRSYRKLIHRLQPTEMLIEGSDNGEMNILKGLDSLRILSLGHCPKLQNLNALVEVPRLGSIECVDCPDLENLDGLKSASELTNLKIVFCQKLRSVDGLKNISTLLNLSLNECPALRNIDALKGLRGLIKLALYKTPNISMKALSELRAALPSTDIVLPDGTESPAPNTRQ